MHTPTHSGIYTMLPSEGTCALHVADARLAAVLSGERLRPRRQLVLEHAVLVQLRLVAAQDLALAESPRAV